MTTKKKCKDCEVYLVYLCGIITTIVALLMVTALWYFVIRTPSYEGPVPNTSVSQYTHMATVECLTKVSNYGWRVDYETKTLNDVYLVETTKDSFVWVSAEPGFDVWTKTTRTCSKLVGYKQ